ncbi:MAG: DUF1292 domain-containing protein [Clostridia bacterium]|nr:DUF1292 domain-containing protein [Clostridia bacterium]
MTEEIKNVAEELDGELDSTKVVEEIEIVTLTDEDGKETEFELIGRLTLADKDYIALMAQDNDEEYLILRSEKDADGEEVFVTIEDDEEFDAVADAFDDEFMSEFDYDFGVEQ